MENKKRRTGDEFSKNLGGTLRRLRSHRGLSQKDVAKILSVSFQQIQKYETGQNRLPIEKLLVLKHLYAIPLDNFFVDSAPSWDAPYDGIYYEGIHRRLGSLKNPQEKDKIYRILDILISA